MPFFFMSAIMTLWTRTSVKGARKIHFFSSGGRTMPREPPFETIGVSAFWMVSSAA